MKPTLQKQLRWCFVGQWTLAAITVLVCSGVILLGIVPARARLATMQQSLVAGRQQWALSQGKASELPALEMGTQELRQRIGTFSQRIPAEEDLAGFIRQISAIAKQVSISDLAWRPEPRSAAGTLWQVPIQLSFAGNFSQLAAFLRKTEAIPRLTQVQNLDVHSAPGLDGLAGNVDVQITMAIFYSDQ